MISDLESMKVISDPLRFQLLEMLTDQPLTVKQIAVRLGLSPSRLYYHVNMLEKHNMIQVVETRLVSGIQEKTFAAVADNFEIAPELLSRPTDRDLQRMESLIASHLDLTRQDLIRSLRARARALERGAEPHPRGTMVTRVTAHLDDSLSREFLRRLHDLVEEFEAASQPGEDRQLFSLTVACFPTFYYEDEDPQGETPSTPSEDQTK